MTSPSRTTASQEQPRRAVGGFPMLLVNLVLISVAPIVASTAAPRPLGVVVLSVLVTALGVLSMFGLFTLQLNEARVLILFGAYRGTVRDSGFHWANPFYSRYRGRVPGKGHGRADSVGSIRIGG
jgi:hypothetical protein